MTCANCVATVERNLKRVNGVTGAVVNLSSERATVEFDPTLVVLPDIIGWVERAGYGVATGEADLTIKRLSDANSAQRLEKALLQTEGVLEAQVSLATERARVRYVPTIVSQAEIRRSVADAGFEALELGGDADDAEAKARAAEISHQKRMLIIGLIFTAPLFIFSMSRDFGLLGMWAHADWVHWVMLAFATPVQFYVGAQYYVGAYTAVRNGAANMDVLIALGTTAAYVYSLPIVFGCLAYQRADGLFHDILNDSQSFVETNAAQMLAYTIYRGVAGGWLDRGYLAHADRMRVAAHGKVDAFGLVQGVCGAPHFNRSGTATEGQAFFLLMEAAHRDLDRCWRGLALMPPADGFGRRDSLPRRGRAGERGSRVERRPVGEADFPLPVPPGGNDRAAERRPEPLCVFTAGGGEQTRSAVGVRGRQTAAAREGLAGHRR